MVMNRQTKNSNPQCYSFYESFSAFFFSMMSINVFLVFPVAVVISIIFLYMMSLVNAFLIWRKLIHYSPHSLSIKVKKLKTSILLHRFYLF